MSKPIPMSAMTLLALLLSTPTSAPPGATRPRDFLSELLDSVQPCEDPTCKACHPAPAAKAESSAADNLAATPANADSLMASAGFSQPEPTGQQEAAAPQDEVRASGGVSLAACRAVGLVDADTGTTAQLKASAAAFITCLEDIRDSLLPGTRDRNASEEHIAAVARACAWAVPKHAHDAS